jgi:Asp-tRNA(Asn)/Glu-tRNA(Gln) amidotransferase C subunit
LNIPKPLKGTASRQELRDQNKELFRLLKLAEEQIQRDHAQKRLMDHENERLRQRLHWKQKKKEDKRTTAEARHMTSDESLDEGAKAQWRTQIKEFHKLAKPIFKKKCEDIDEYYCDLLVQEKTRGDEEKRKAAQEKKAQAAAEKEEAAWRREMANVAKYAEDYEVALQKQALWEEKKRKAANAKAAKTKATKGKGRHIETSSEESDEFDKDNATETEEVAAPSTSNVLVNISVSGGAGVALTSPEPDPSRRYPLRARRGR